MAKNAKSKDVKINIELSIPQEVFDTFNAASGENVNEYITSCVSEHLLAYADGGLMLSGEDVAAIGEIIGDDVTSSSDVVRAVSAETSSNADETGVYKIYVDPSLVANVKTSADFIGVTIEQWMNTCWGHIMANGWLYGISGDIRWIPFDQKKIMDIEKEYGKPLNSSTSICDALTSKIGEKS